jgi:hypothetical protein
MRNDVNVESKRTRLSSGTGIADCLKTCKETC